MAPGKATLVPLISPQAQLKRTRFIRESLGILSFVENSGPRCLGFPAVVGKTLQGRRTALRWRNCYMLRRQRRPVGNHDGAGYIFITWKGDHPPRHVHVYSDGRPIEKWDLDNQKPMKGAATRRILELIAKMEAEGCCEDSLCQTQQSEKGVRGRHIEDFFVALNLFDTFDSRPATTSVDRNDVGIVLSFGWTYQRSAPFPMTTENSTGGDDQPHRVQ